MEPLAELKLYVDAIARAVEADPKFFASVKHYVDRLQQLLNGSVEPTLSELKLLTSKLEEFWSKWRRKPGGGLYIPPRQVADTDNTVARMQVLVSGLAAQPTAEFQQIVDRFTVAAQPGADPRRAPQPRVFIGHGHSPLWARVKTFLESDLGLKTVTYESEPRTGDSIVPILQNMLDESTFAVLLLTAEDEDGTGGKRARQNVIHEAGLFQGRLGFRRAVLLVQEGIEEFSNVAGLQHIPFAGNRVDQTFYELRRVLERERQLDR